MKKHLSKIIVIISIATTSIFTLGFVDSYFEVSKNLDIFATLFRELNIYYVDEAKPGDLMKTGIDAMLESLDPYTNYIPESKMEDYKMMTTGQYGGIGALIQKQESFVIISEPYEGFGAFKSGLRAGDKIVEIDGKSAKDKNSSEIREFLLGEPGTTVSIKIERPGTTESITKTVTREEVKIKDVPYFAMVSDTVGYIKLTGFTETASAEVKSALKELTAQNAKSFVLDLRGNGGGLLREAVNIVNLFVDQGTEVVYTKGKVKDWDKSYKALSAPFSTTVPLVVLVDGGSASASEIVSGSLQDNDRAVIVGSQSFGKGLVQQVRPLSYNSKLKVTVAKYYTPSGRCIQKLDYSHKNKSGEAEEVPDSLIAEFKTLVNKRSVFDGNGIAPDLKASRDFLSDITSILVIKNLIFNYATEYRLKHDSIASASSFTLTDAEYEDFVSYLKDKDYAYTTESESILKDLEEVTKKDKFYDGVKEEYAALKEKLGEHKKDDLYEFKSEIKFVLENEIIARYYFQVGKMAAALNNDPAFDVALKTINDPKTYGSILKGSYKKQ